MSASDPYTTISVRTSTLRALQIYKTGGQSWDDVLTGFISNRPPEEYLRMLADRLEHGHFKPAKQVYRKAGIL